MNRYRFLLLCCLLALAACSTASGYAGSESTPTSVSRPNGPLPDTLIVTRTNELPQNTIPPLSPRTVQNAQAVQQLYQAAYAQPHFPSGVFHCPVDSGVVYHLQFLYQGATVLQADLRAGGCRALFLSPNDSRQTTDDFWSLFSTVAGIPPSDLHPMPQS